MLTGLLSLVAQLAAIRWAVKTLIGVGVLVPVAFLLKVVGLPILAVLGVLALPVAFVLFLFGLPIILVLVVAAVLMGGLFFMLSIGLVAFKIFIFVILPVWLLYRLVSWIFGSKRAPAATSDGM